MIYFSVEIYITDNEMAEKIQLARDKLFDKILAAWLLFQAHFWIRKECNLKKIS